MKRMLAGIALVMIWLVLFVASAVANDASVLEAVAPWLLLPAGWLIMSGMYSTVR